MGNKKNGIVLGIVIAAMVLIAAIGSASAYDCDRDVYPGPGTPLKDNITDAAVGDTICVHAGTYNEWQIDVGKNLTLIGVDGMANVIVDGTGGSNYLMKVSADEVTVSGFTLQKLQDCSSGVMIVDGSHCNISYNDIHQGQAFTFSMSSGTDDNTLKGNTIYYASCGCEGMFTIRGTNHVVTDNIIGQQGGAIRVYCTDSLIYNNDFGTGISVPGTGNTWNTTYVSGENIIDGPYMGGSFYANYVGDDEYSGPDQSEPGSDGIGDTPYGEDKLPLVPYECGCVGETQTFTCGGTVTESCTFNCDLTCTGVGLLVGAPDIVIDGGDHKLIGSVTPADCTGCGEVTPCAVSGILNAGYDDVVVKNLKIEGFCTGIALKGTGGNKVENNTVDNCEIHDNGFSDFGMVTHGVHVCWTEGTAAEPGVTITNSEIYNNEGAGAGCSAGGNGIFIYAGSPPSKHEYCDISGNKLYNNAKAGFWTKKQLSKSKITNNEVWSNGAGAGITDNVRGGIILRCKGSNDNLIAHNDIYDNVGSGADGYGIFVGGNGNTVINNTLNDNSADGISMWRSDASSNTELRNNTVRMNGRHGVFIEAGTSGNELYDNVVCDNGQISGVDIHDGDDTIGDRNRCDTSYNYSDIGAVPPNVCMYQCSQGIPITSCNFNADIAGGYYYLDDDLNCNAGEVGVIIGANDVIIDGQDHNLIGNVTSADCTGCGEDTPCAISGIYNDGNDNVVVKNLKIEGFCTGIALKGTGGNKVENNTVDNCEIRDNGFSDFGMVTHGVHVCWTEGTAAESGVTITNSEVYNNEGAGAGCSAGGNGIFIYAGSPPSKHEYCDISGNKLYNNAKAGFWTKKQLSKSKITNNEVWSNGAGAGITDNVRGGIILRCKGSNDNLIAYNEVYDNVGSGADGYGIFVGGNDNTVINNTVTGNSADGISMWRSDASSNTELRNNTVRMNGRHGVFIESGTSGNELYDNVVCDNGQISGVDIHDGDDTTGDNNTCDTGYNYNDTSATPPDVCVNPCDEEPDLIIEDIRPIKWCCCCIHLRGDDRFKPLKGGDDKGETMQVMFIDDPELAKELGDEKLRKEVAEVLAKDPKQAEEIAAKIAGDDKELAEKLREGGAKHIAEYCCCKCSCDSIKELADLLGDGIDFDQQDDMSDLLYKYGAEGYCCGGCGGCCCPNEVVSYKCCCCGRAIAYRIANDGDGDAGWSLSTLYIEDALSNRPWSVRSVDIVRPLDAGKKRWEIFPYYSYYPTDNSALRRPLQATVCADATDWVAESDETNNCRSEIIHWPWWCWWCP